MVKSTPTPFTGFSTYGHIREARSYTSENGELSLSAKVIKEADHFTSGLFEWRTTDLDFMLFADLLEMDGQALAGIQVTGSASNQHIFFQLLYDGKSIILNTPSSLVATAAFEPPQKMALRHLILMREGEHFKIAASEKGAPPNSIAELTIAQEQPVFIGVMMQPTQVEQQATVKYANINLSITDNEQKAMMPKSRIMVLDIERGLQKSLLHEKGLLHSPQWSPKEDVLYYVKEGELFSFSLEEKLPKKLDSLGIKALNGHCGFSPNGSLLALSHRPENQGNSNQSVISLVNLNDQKIQALPLVSPAHWLGWSPDSQHVIYSVQKEENLHQVGIFNLNQQKAKVLLEEKGYLSGAALSPNGSHLYFSSSRSGSMQVWRHSLKGEDPLQITDDAYQNWQPHLSKDGQKLVFLSTQKVPEESPKHQNSLAMLRLLDLQTQQISILATFFGSPESLQNPCWSPNGQQLAFVAYSFEAYF